jgi:hypothetical protein
VEKRQCKNKKLLGFSLKEDAQKERVFENRFECAEIFDCEIADVVVSGVIDTAHQRLEVSPLSNGWRYQCRIARAN